MQKGIEVVHSEILEKGHSLVHEESIPALGSETHVLKVSIRETACGGVPGHYVEVVIFDDTGDDTPSFLRGNRIDGVHGLEKAYELGVRFVEEALSLYTL